MAVELANLLNLSRGKTLPNFGKFCRGGEGGGFDPLSTTVKFRYFQLLSYLQEAWELAREPETEQGRTRTDFQFFRVEPEPVRNRNRRNRNRRNQTENRNWLGPGLKS